MNKPDAPADAPEVSKLIEEIKWRWERLTYAEEDLRDGWRKPEEPVEPEVFIQVVKAIIVDQMAELEKLDPEAHKTLTQLMQPKPKVDPSTKST
jgi:hypothetical protein